MSKTYLFRARFEHNWAGDPYKDATPTYVAPQNLPIKLDIFKIAISPNEASGFNNDVPYDINYPLSPIYIEFTVDASDDRNPEAMADEQLEKLESLFRLFQKGSVFVRRDSTWVIKDGKPDRDFFFNSPLIKPEPTPEYERGIYVINDNFSDIFNTFFHKYWKIINEKQQPIYNALIYFNSSYEKRTLAERLLELIIALEALFGEEGDSLTYKIALRCACSLYPKGKERQKKYEYIKKTYKERSKIVHGDRLGTEYTEEKIDMLEDIVRNAILYFLKYATDGKPITEPKILDDLLFLL